MTYVNINGQQYQAAVTGYLRDRAWDNRDSKAITLEMDYTAALETFVDDAEWSIIFQPESYTIPETGETITPEAEIYDNSDYCVAGPITDNRNGTVTVKMGKPTAAELLSIIIGGN